MFTMVFCMVVLVLLMSSKNSEDDGEVTNHAAYGKFNSRLYCDLDANVLSTFFLFDWQGVQTSKINYELGAVLRADSVDWYKRSVWTYKKMEEQYASIFNMIGDSLPDHNWHTFSIEWSPDMVVWVVDDVVLKSVISPSYPFEYGDPLMVLHDLWANISAQRIGHFDPSTPEAYQFIHWMSIYSWAGNGHQFSTKPIFFDDFNEDRKWLEFDDAEWGENTIRLSAL